MLMTPTPNPRMCVTEYFMCFSQISSKRYGRNCASNLSDSHKVDDTISLFPGSFVPGVITICLIPFSLNYLFLNPFPPTTLSPGYDIHSWGKHHTHTPLQYSLSFFLSFQDFAFFSSPF